MIITVILVEEDDDILVYIKNYQKQELISMLESNAKTQSSRDFGHGLKRKCRILK